MTTETASLIIKVDSSGAKRASDDLDGLTQSAQKTEARALALGTAMGHALYDGAKLATQGLLSVFRNSIRAEQELAQLDAVLKSTGNAAGYSRDQLVGMAEALSKASTFSAGEIVEAETRLLSYSGVLGENIPRAMQAVIDQSARLGISLAASSETIGKALESPSKAAEALSRQGFGAAFTKEVRATIDALVAAGREAEAQRVVLGILEESYAGAARAARDTFGGALSALQNTLGDLVTGGEGSLKGATKAVNELVETLQSESVREGFSTIVNGMVSTAAATAGLIGKLGELQQSFLDTDRQSADFLQKQLDGLQREIDAINNDETGAWTIRAKLGFDNDKVIADLKAQMVPIQAALDKLKPKVTIIDNGQALPESVLNPKASAPSATDPIKERIKATKELTQAEQEELLYQQSLLAVGSETLRMSADQAQAERDKRGATADLIEQMEFELSLVGMTNVEREKAIALRRAGVDAMSEEGQKIAQLVEQHGNYMTIAATASEFSGAFADSIWSIVDGSKSAGEAFSDMAKSILKDLATMTIRAIIFRAIISAMGGNTPSMGAAMSAMGGFSRGGYTGDGGKNEPAGLVHKGEVVWSQSDVARAGGVGVVEAMRLGWTNDDGKPERLTPARSEIRIPLFVVPPIFKRKLEPCLH